MVLMLIRPASFANENGPRFQGARAGSMGRHGAGSGNGKETPSAVPLRLHQCASAASHQFGNRATFAHLHGIKIAGVVNVG
jgi:hypothetical protein